MPLKQFQVTYGRNYTLSTTVVLSGVEEGQVFTQQLARRAAHIACGHYRDVRVTSTDYFCYRLLGWRSFREST